MSKEIVTFHKCIENTDEFCANPNYICSKLIFSVNDSTDVHNNLECIVKQYKGCPTDGRTSIDIDFIDRSIDINYDKLSQAAIDYYKNMSQYYETATQLVNSTENMFNNNIIQDKSYDISF